MTVSAVDKNGMRALSDIFGTSSRSMGAIYREILFEDGLWCMYRRPDYDDGRALIIHRCAPSQCAVATDITKSDDIAKATCGNGGRDGGCGEHVPEKLQGLYMMYVWER